MIFLSLAVLIRIVSNSISNVFQKQLTPGQNPFFINLVSYGILSVISLFLIYDFPIHYVSNSFWLYSLIGGMMGAIGNGFIIKALESGQLSVLGPINAYKSIVGMIFAFILIGELPNVWGLIGVLFIIFGSYLVLDNGNEKFSWKIFKQPAIQYRIAALFLTGIQAVTDKQVILLSNLKYAFAGWCVFGFIFSIPLFIFSGLTIKSQMKLLTGSMLIKYFFLAASIGVMVLCTNYVFKNMQVGIALALFQISILVNVFFGHHFFKELGLVKKLIGASIMVAGSILIILLK
jgi:drug/metabolite transporter (DMT)-like permease